MKIKLNQPILTFHGEPLTEQGKQVTFGQVFRNLLGMSSEKDNGEKLLKKYNLGIKCIADEVDLSVDERSLIKELVEQNLKNPLIYGRTNELFEE